MPPVRRPAVPRRRRADDGEEEGSVVGEVEDDSLSEGSALSAGEEDGDAEVSDASVDDEKEHASQTRPPKAQTKQALAQDTSTPQDLPASAPTFQASADNDAMLNGLTASAAVDGVEELNFDDATAHETQAKIEAVEPTEPETSPPKAPRNESYAQKARREHQDYIKERNTNPAFVPNRGGFFLHDDRSSMPPAFNGASFPRGRGRGFDTGFHGPRPLLSEPTTKQWAHDLHDKHESPPTQAANSSTNNLAPQSRLALTSTIPLAPSGPNRTFSFSSVVGNVTVYVSLPGMSDRKAITNVAKKQHTLLPHHRPPLRRDKPVRISIPEEHPRYIFPSTERSFIFIPRALRPNQQSYFRGRGRGSFHGSRRTSVFGGSNYTPSVAMSRKSSFGGVPRDNVRSPTGSTSSRAMMMGAEGPRPIVRLPSAGMMFPPMPMMQPPSMPYTPDPAAQMNGTMAYGFHSTAIPMHQPRPQKTVSVADIESPASLSVKAPQQQQQQPFHQQMPVYGGDEHRGPSQMAGQSTEPGGTPLSHIPEGAIYAQAFHPYPYMQPQMMYAPPYGNPAAFYPPMVSGMPYAVPMPGMPLVPGFVAPGMQPGPQQQPPMNQAQQQNSMAHESNGMVFYYEPSQVHGGSQAEQYPIMSGPAMMNPQAPFYYPNGPNGMYYPAQPT